MGRAESLRTSIKCDMQLKRSWSSRGGSVRNGRGSQVSNVEETTHSDQRTSPASRCFGGVRVTLVGRSAPLTAAVPMASTAAIHHGVQRLMTRRGSVDVAAEFMQLRNVIKSS